MSRYSFILITVLLGFVSCAQKPHSVLTDQIKIVNSAVKSDSARIDTYALIAMDAYERGDYKTASLFFEKLYDLDPQKEYLVDAIKAASIAKEYERIKKLIEKGKGEFGDDKFINRYLVAYYLEKGKSEKAKEIVTKLLQKAPEPKDFELAAVIATMEGDLSGARKYYQKAYKIDHSPHVALALAEILRKQNESDRAVRLLETHTRIYGCDKALCSALIKIYTAKQDLRALESIYKKLYRTTQEPLYANALLELYVYQKNFDAAVAFLKKYKLSEETLLDIYTAKKDFANAYKTAMKLYHESGDLKFLARAAVLEYESTPKKSDKLLKSVLQKFEKSVYRLDNPLYYNYYAYLLIDHNIDVEKGLKLVQKALKAEPDSLFYIDTLAWGYYRLGKCEAAYKLLKPFEKEELQEEIADHIRQIKQCIKEKRE